MANSSESHLSPLAGKPVPANLLIDISKLEKDYFSISPDPENKSQAVSFGTSGHRGTATNGTFNEAHVHAITQAICEVRKSQGISGPLFLGKDTHALSILAERSALEVLAANGVTVVIQSDNGFTPTPVISHAILTHNRNKNLAQSDGIVITPSHNPPADAGIKYNSTNGGPSEVNLTSEIQKRANELLKGGNKEVKKIPFNSARSASTTSERDFALAYIEDLSSVLNLDRVSAAKLKIGVHPLGGASVHYWNRIAETYHLNISVVDKTVDATFKFMTVDHDGKVRMDCSSPYAMTTLIGLKNSFDIAFGTDPDADRHGIVSAEGGLFNPNHYLAIAIDYLIHNRPSWKNTVRVGKTIVSSTLIDRVIEGAKREVFETPVGFKWFAPGLFDGSVCFGGEESAGASFIRKDGSPWSTDKDGLLLGLLACEITATTQRDLFESYKKLSASYGEFSYRRVDLPATASLKKGLTSIDLKKLTLKEIAGDAVISLTDEAPGNHAKIGGVKASSEYGWFAARPSGTEDIVKIYAESFRNEDHLDRIISDAGSFLNSLT